MQLETQDLNIFKAVYLICLECLKVNISETIARVSSMNLKKAFPVASLIANNTLNDSIFYSNAEVLRVRDLSPPKSFKSNVFFVYLLFYSSKSSSKADFCSILKSTSIIVDFLRIGNT